jgi:hypothetical protein
MNMRRAAIDVSSPVRRVLALIALGAAMACCVSGAHAHTSPEPLPAAASAVLARRFPELRVLSHTAGALHADGARDIAVVLGRGERGARIVSVLWSEAGGGYRFADASGDIAAACAGCDVAVRVVARERVLEVGTSDPGGATASVRTWRFAYRGTKGDVLRLVGVRSEQIWHGDSGDGGGDGVIDNVASTDLLTGAKLDVIEGDRRGRHRRLEAGSRVPLRQPILFDQFSFDFKGAAAETRFVFGRDFERR